MNTLRERLTFDQAVFTAFTWSVNEVAVNGSNYMSEEMAESLTPTQRQHTIWGSKMTLAMEMFTLTTIWTVKGCLCLMFYRLTCVVLQLVRRVSG